MSEPQPLSVTVSDAAHAGVGPTVLRSPGLVSPAAPVSITSTQSGSGHDAGTVVRPVSVGIDLGTTRTVVAVADRGNYPVVSFTDTDGDAHPYLPSLTALVDGHLVHGFEAQEAARQGATVLRSLKRRLSDPLVRWGTPVRVGDQELAVGEVLTSYLTYLRKRLETSPELAGADLGAPVTRVVVAVPAHAWGAQRMLTLDAFAAAGFHVVAMLNEPSAAGFEYTHRQGATVSSRRTRVVVYDLGGGTFDTSLVDVSGSAHEVLISQGLADLGGDDVDLVLAQMAMQAAGVTEAELSGSQSDDLLEQCQQAKESLAPQTRRIAVEVAGRTVVLSTREIYEACQPLIDRSVSLVDPLVAQMDQAPSSGQQGGPAPAGSPDDDQPQGNRGRQCVGMVAPEIAGIYLVGGASSFPPVGRALRARYGRRVHRSPYPGSSTAIGLAIAADPDSGYALTDRLSRGFGVFREQAGGTRTSFDPILLPDTVQAGALGTTAAELGAESTGATVLERSYQAVHNVGRYRFVECGGIDERGEPTGRLAPAGELLFPLDSSLRDLDDADLAVLPVCRLGHGPRVRERYEVDPAGRVNVTLTDCTDGYTRRYVLGWQVARDMAAPDAQGR